MNTTKQLLYKILDRFYRLTIQHPFCAYLGRFFLKRSPSATIYENFFSTQDGLFRGLIRVLCVRAELQRQFQLATEAEQKRMIYELYASNTASKRNTSKKEKFAEQKKFNNEFLGRRGPLVSQIRDFSTAHPNYHTICEIGTAQGLFLDYLAKQIPNIKRFVGIDINEEQILENRKVYKNTKLEFEYTEVADWITSQAEPRTLFVTFGTLMCFTPKELSEFLKLICEKASPAAIAISEATDFVDLTGETTSKPRYNGFAYNHNYLHLFKQSNYQVLRQQVQHTKGLGTRMVLLATTPSE